MKKYLLIFLFFFYSNSIASIKENIIKNLNDINNIALTRQYEFINASIVENIKGDKIDFEILRFLMLQ